MPGELRVFEPEQKFGAEGGSGYGRGDGGPAERGGERISKAAAQREVDGEGDDVGKSFEEQVGMDDVGADVEVDGKDCGGMERRDDWEL